MAFMQPQAMYLTKQEAREYVPLTEFEDSIGNEEYEAGWYGRLSAPGYMDCTDWAGPFLTEKEALKAIQDLYEVNENGDDLPEEE